LVVFAVIAIEKYLDDPVGALSAHGLAGIWGTLAVGLFGTERLVGDTASPGLWYGIIGDVDFGAALGQLGVQTVGVVATFVWVFAASMVVFYAIKKTVGLRVPEDEELAGLDISSHGMYGYPEQFIPPEEYPAHDVEPHVAGTPVAPPATVTAMTANQSAMTTDPPSPRPEL
jgi:Amt family ammonium transporter